MASRRLALPVVLAAFALPLAACNQQVAVRPSTPAAARGGPRSTEAVGLHLSPDFQSRQEVVEWGPASFTFDIGRGGSPMVRQVVEARFARVIPVPAQPPLAAGTLPDVHGILVPKWTDFDQRIEQKWKEGAPEDSIETTDRAFTSAVLEVSLRKRDGSVAWTRSFSGKDERVLPKGAGGTSPLSAAANAVLEQIGEGLAEALGDAAVGAAIAQARAADEAAAAMAAKGAARKGAKRLYVHPFAGKGPGAAGAPGLQSQVVSELVGGGHFVVVADPEQQAKLDTAVRQVNRDATSSEEWIAIGQGRGAQLMLSGELATSGAACSVKVELTDITSRLVQASYFKSLKVCSPETLSGAAGEAATRMIEGL